MSGLLMLMLNFRILHYKTQAEDTMELTQP